MANTPDNQIQPEIRALLVRLRRRIRRYLLLEGLALVLALVAVLFWISLGLDWTYFQLRSLELPVWFRKAFTIGTACLFVGSFTAWVVLRMMRSFRSKSLALVLERRFPELNDRLVTAVELADAPPEELTPLGRSMLQRTVDAAVRDAQQINVGAVFNNRPLRYALVSAVVLITSIGGLAIASEPTLDRWARAYLRWDDEYWSRETELVVRVVAQPGDRVREFDNFRYKHPRGEDLTLLVEVPEGRKEPERVQLQYTLDGGRGGGRVLMSRIGDRQFRHAIGSLLDSLEFSIWGGDFTNRIPYRVEVVDPPRVDSIVLHNDYPDYTRLDVAGADGKAVRHEQRVMGTQVSVPLETDMLLKAKCNKPLVGVRVETTAFSLSLSTHSSVLTISSADGASQREIPLSPEAVAPLFGGTDEFTLPLMLTAKATERLGGLQAGSALPIPLPADSLLRIYLHDADDVISSEPARVTVNGIVDQPPVVDTQLKGIGSSITRKAVIPVTGLVTDDYGLDQVRFEYRIDDTQGWQKRAMSNSLDDAPREFTLRESDDVEAELFEVLPLDLALGKKLVLTVFAQDGDNHNGPHITRGQSHAFTIVSEEELLSILYGKEINLRRRFEQIITEAEQLKQDLQLHRDRAREAGELRTSAGGNISDEQKQTLAEADSAVSVSAERGLQQVRKNASESLAIEESFREILQELLNNAVHTGQMVERVDGLILAPMHSINEKDFPAVDASIGLFKLANEKQQDPAPRIDESVQAIDAMLAHMRAVLAEMKDLVEFHEALKDLKQIIDGQEELSEETRSRRKKDLIEGLKGLDVE